MLHNRVGGSTDNIDTTYTVNLSSEVRNGAWKLRVTDAASADVGFLNGWALTPSESDGGRFRRAARAPIDGSHQ